MHDHIALEQKCGIDFRLRRRCRYRSAAKVRAQTFFFHKKKSKTQYTYIYLYLIKFGRAYVPQRSLIKASRMTWARLKQH